jgi:lysophospholipase L1-like esterase
MTDINTKSLKRPLGRILKDRLLQQQRRDRYRSSSRNEESCVFGCRTDRCVTLLVVVASFCLLYSYGIIGPAATVALVGNNVVESGDTSIMSFDNVDVSTAKKEDAEINNVSNQNKDSNQDKNEEPQPIQVVPLSSIRNRPIRIFCYGDSLTAGVAPPTQAFFPYAEALQKSLTDNAEKNGKQITFEVEHAGFPGWTAKELKDQLISDGKNNNVRPKLLLRDPEKSEASYYDILIYLAGTNAWAHHVARIPFTIAVSVPPSEFQLHNSNAAARAATINKDLRKVIRRNFPRFSSSAVSTLWAPFPIPFNGGDSSNKEWWATDGLHLSQLGYQRLGDYLALMIYDRMLK